MARNIRFGHFLQKHYERTGGWTDGRTDTASYRDARTHLKSQSSNGNAWTLSRIPHRRLLKHGINVNKRNKTIVKRRDVLPYFLSVCKNHATRPFLFLFRFCSCSSECFYHFSVQFSYLLRIHCYFELKSINRHEIILNITDLFLFLIYFLFYIYKHYHHFSLKSIILKRSNLRLGYVLSIFLYFWKFTDGMRRRRRRRRRRQ